MLVLPKTLATDAAAAVTSLAERQDAVVRNEQLRLAGVPGHTIDYMLVSKRWQQDADRLVIVMHNGPLSAAQREGVAVLAGGRLCGLAARTAAARAGLQGWPAPKVEIVVPRGTTYPRVSLVDVRVHESRRFTVEDVHPNAWPPRVRIERAIIDAAAWSRSARAACGLLAASVQQRLTRADRLLAALGEAGQVRHARLMSSALVDIAGGAQAMSELDFVRFCRRNHLPEPVLQAVRRDPQGRRRYLDATLNGPTGRLVRVEVDGALHLLVASYWDDMHRDNELAIAREMRLRIPSFAIHSDDARVLDQLRRALDLSGPRSKTAA